MNPSIQRACIYSGPAFLVLYLVAFWKVAGYLPPHPPTLALAELSQFYLTHQTQIRSGQVLCLVFSTLLFPWFAVISAQMAHAEGRFPVLAIMQFGGSTLLVVFFQICSMLWIIATYRTDLDPMVLRLIHEGAWLVFVMVFPSFSLQLVCIAVAGFCDTHTPPWLPRWACFFNLWVALSAAGGAVAVFFKTGPFAWNGAVGFWIPVLMFALWLIVMMPLLLRNTRAGAHV